MEKIPKNDYFLRGKFHLEKPIKTLSGRETAEKKLVFGGTNNKRDEIELTDPKYPLKPENKTKKALYT